MNDAPALSAAAHQPSDRHDEPGRSSHGRDAAEDAPVREQTRSSSPVRKRRAGQAKKLQFVTELMTSLDMLVYAEMAALYYME